MPERTYLLQMNSSENGFFQDLGKRVATARKEQGLTQSELAELLGVTQPVIASYETGRRKIPAVLLPPISKELRISLTELLGEPQKTAKRGPTPKLLKQFEAVSTLPKERQKFVSQFLDTVLSQTAS